MKHDPQLAFSIADVTKGLVNHGHIAFAVRERDVAHRYGTVAGYQDGGIVDLVTAPVLQGEAAIAGVFRITSDEIGKRAFTGCAERGRCCGQRRLE